MPFKSTSNLTTFVKGHIRSKESINKQRHTMKIQYKSGERSSKYNRLGKILGRLQKFKSTLKCLHCGKVSQRIAGNQKWCLECVPNGKFRNIMQRYNLSNSDYNNLLITNNGLCWVCLKRKAKFVDHCHKTGKVRGLLCAHCNSALVLIEDRATLRRALKYVSVS